MIRPAQILVHPAWLTSLAVLVLNDHVLKAALHSPLTGKLSDLAGLVVAPALLAALIGVRSTRGWWTCHAAVGTVFAAIQLSPAAADAWSLAMAVVGMPWAIVSDPTDLLALPVLAVSALGFRNALVPRGRTPRAALLAGGVGLVACVATSPVHGPGRAGFDAEVWIHNATDADLEVHLRALRPDVRLDCDDVLADPGAHLPRALFDTPALWSLPSGGTLPASEAFGEPCQAAWLEGPELDPVVLAWRSDDHPAQWIRSWFAADKRRMPAGGVRIEALDGVTFTQDADQGLAYAPVTPDPETTCPLPAAADRLVWDWPMHGDAVVTGVHAGPDGCLGLDLDDDRRYLCGVDPTLLVFAEGDRLAWHTQVADDGADQLTIDRRVDDVLTQTLIVARGTVPTGLRLASTPSACTAAVDDACGTVEVTMDTSAAWAGGDLVPASAGETVALGGARLHLAWLTDRYAVDPTCSHGPERAGSLVELAILLGTQD